MQYEFSTWEEAFGLLHPKGTHIEKMQDLRDKQIDVYNRIEELREQGNAVGGDLFEKVGKEFGLGGKTKVEEIYYAIHHSLHAFENEKSWDHFISALNKRKIV